MLQNGFNHISTKGNKSYYVKINYLESGNFRLVFLKPGVHTNDFAPIHGRRARIHTAPAESTVDSTYCLPQALCEYGRADRESGRNR